MSRVLVVGSGMAGTAAALAARAAGAEVTVVGDGPGATGFATGVLWSESASELPPSFEALPEGTRRLANVIGEVVYASAALPPQARGVLPANGGVRVVGLRGAPQLLDAEWVASGLRRVGIEAQSRWIDLYLTVDECRRSPVEWARALDASAEQARWAAALKTVVREGFLVLLPPMMGFEATTLDRIQQVTGGKLGELVATAQAVPGFRLSADLEARRGASGARFTRATVVRLEPGRATLSTGGNVEFDGAVLATGKFLGGGLGRKHIFRETVCDLPLSLDGGPAPAEDAAIEELAGDRPGLDAAAFRIGLCTDGEQHPLGADRQPLPWLHAAGSLLAGFDRGMAFAWASGTSAGKRAAQGSEQSRSAVA